LLPAKKDESIEAIKFEINKLIKEGITKEELDRAKNYLIGKNDISMQRNSSVNSRILLSYLYGLDINEPFNFMNQIENVDMNSINESIEEFLAAAKFVTVSVDPN
jgi:zinc protease